MERPGTGSGATQQFIVPNTATRLFLGFADSYNSGSNTISGAPSFYGDNDGTLNATFSISSESASALPEPHSTPLLLVGLLALGLTRRSRSRR